VLVQALSRLGISLIRSAPPAGQVMGRLGAALNTASDELVAQGADPYAVDQAALECGFMTTPFVRIDRDGIGNVAGQIEKYRAKIGLAARDQGVLSALVDLGRTGLAAGRGFYLHGNGQPKQDPALAALLSGLTRGRAAAELTPARLTAAVLGAVINEAVLLLDQGVIERASDIDLLMVREFGFDRAKGGPLLQADLRGPFHLFKEMQALSQLSPLWAPHPRFQTMIKNGDGFFGRGVV